MTEPTHDRRSRPRGLARRAGDALYSILRFIARHVRGFYGAVLTYLSLAFFVFLGAVWGFAILADEVLEGGTQGLDEAVLTWISAHRTAALDQIALEVTALGNTATLVVLILAVTTFLWLTRHRYSVLLLFTALAGGAILDDLRRADHVPRSIRRKQRKIAAAEESLSGNLDRKPDARETANRIGIDVETFWRWKADAEESIQVSLDQPATTSSGGTVAQGDVLEGSSGREIEDFVNHEQEVRVLRDEIACKPAILAETDRYVAFGSEYRALAGLPGIIIATTGVLFRNADKPVTGSITRIWADATDFG